MKMKYQAIDYISTIVILSFLNLLLVTIDRLISIRYPIFYKTISTGTGIAAILATWLISLAYTALLIIVDHARYYAGLLMFTLIVISFLTLSITNAVIYNIVQKQIKEISKTIVSYC